ncbi:uncharacterized protein LOC144133831 [Amblyomma americanum]
MYAPDGVCHYMYYTNVFLDEENFMATELQVSFQRFKDVLKMYSKTKGGLSFDIKYVDLNSIKQSKTAILTLASNNIGSYGFLNMIAPIDILQGWVEKAKDLLKELKGLQGKDPTRRTIIAIGTFRYSEGATWTKYKDLFKTAIARDYGADVVIAVTSTHIQENITNCKVLPPAIVTAVDGNFPSFAQIREFVTESYPHSNAHIIVGVSVESSALSYKHTEKISHVKDIQLYKNCDEFTLTTLDVACGVEKTDSTSGYLAEQIAVGLQKASDRYFVLSETTESLSAKVDFIKSLPPWHRFAWLAYNVHMVDAKFMCSGSDTDKHRMLNNLKRLYGIDAAVEAI